MRIEVSQINAAIAAVAPPPGQPWEPELIAASIAATIADEAEDERRWQEGRAAFNVQFARSGVIGGDAAGVDAAREAAIARHAAAVAEKMASNKQLLALVGSAVVTAGTLAMGGAPAAAIAPGLLEASRQIAKALEGV